MAFFRNDAVNRVNLHYAIRTLAYGAGGVFFLAFLLEDGLTVSQALTAFAGILAGRFALRPLILPLARRWGLKPLLIFGVVMTAVQYPLLPMVHGVGIWLAALVLAASVGDIFYWPAYHAYFATIGDAEHRGHQIGAREAMAGAASVVAPLLGAWGLATAGPHWTFGAVAAVQALSALPLIGAPNVAVAARSSAAYRAAWRGFALMTAEGWSTAFFFVVWQVVLFVSLDRSLTAYGGAVAGASLAAAALGLLLGRHLDRGHGRRASLVAFAVAALVVAMRAASVGSPWLAVAANAAGSLVTALAMPATGTAIYNLAKTLPCPLRFNIAAEGAWDIGCAGGTFVAAALAARGAPMGFAILLALPARAVTAALLWRYYGALRVTSPDRSAPSRALEKPLSAA